MLNITDTFCLCKEYTELFQLWNGMFHICEILKMLHEPVTLPKHRSTIRNCNEHELTHIFILASHKYGHIQNVVTSA